MCTRAFVFINFRHSIYCKDMLSLSLSYAHDYQSKATLNSEFATIFSKLGEGEGGSDFAFCPKCQMLHSSRIYSFPVWPKHGFVMIIHPNLDTISPTNWHLLLCLRLFLFLSRFIRLGDAWIPTGIPLISHHCIREPIM